MKYLPITLLGSILLLFFVKYKTYQNYNTKVCTDEMNSGSYSHNQDSSNIYSEIVPNLNLILKPAHLNKYVTWSCENKGRLGNQLFPLLSIYSVGLALNRKVYIDCGNDTMQMIDLIKWIFPKVGGIYEIMTPKNEVQVPLAYENGDSGIRGYENPIIYMNRSEKYLKMHNTYMQNALFIAPYRKEIDSILEFGAEITDIGEKIVEKRKISVDNVFCAHIRQTDFVERNWNKSYEDCLATVRYLAWKQLNRTLIVMGDDKEFMNRMVTELITSGDVAKDSFYSNYTRAEDLYLSRRLCKTFVLTSEFSTFGFWLAWMTGERSRVYYLNENRRYVPQFDAQFPLPWTPINVNNGSVV